LGLGIGYEEKPRDCVAGIAILPEWQQQARLASPGTRGKTGFLPWQAR